MQVLLQGDNFVVSLATDTGSVKRQPLYQVYNIGAFSKIQGLPRRRMAAGIRLTVLLRVTGFCWMKSANSMYDQDI